ncbi:MAG: GGDEF domain-containing protein [Lachnospiraceae bacterium]|nr:GGDEF domain-containing protein [Lachnospiraceae bacterium]
MSKQKPENQVEESKGISLYKLAIAMAIVILVIFVLILLTGQYTNQGYNSMYESTSDYIRWQKSAYDLQTGSDYLTDQVRCFTATGEPEYMNNYFEEAEVTRRRDQALAALQEELAGSDADKYLSEAMLNSQNLMETEYYAMRLTVEAYGIPLDSCPQIIRETQLRADDAALSKEEMKELALDMVLGQEYKEIKAVITDNTQRCLDSLVFTTQSTQINTADELGETLIRQRMLTLILIAVVFVLLLVIIYLVVIPMQQAVRYIRNGESIPAMGTKEFRFLLSAYNQAREKSRRKTGKLAFEASHDFLTGTYNRNGYDRLMKEIDMDSTALLLVDVDTFKQVNDTFGHETGDRVLERVASALRDHFRPQDSICRMGGDEFAVIMEEIDQDPTQVIEKKINHINELLSEPEGDLPATSISVGVAYGEEGDDSIAFFRKADTALYKVKENGRCGVAFFQQINA